jgi:hypothetical protein
MDPEGMTQMVVGSAGIKIMIKSKIKNIAGYVLIGYGKTGHRPIIGPICPLGPMGSYFFRGSGLAIASPRESSFGCRKSGL